MTSDSSGTSRNAIGRRRGRPRGARGRAPPRFRGPEVERHALDEARKVAEDRVERSDERGGPVRLGERDALRIPRGARRSAGVPKSSARARARRSIPSSVRGKPVERSGIGEGGRGRKKGPAGARGAGSPEREARQRGSKGRDGRAPSNWARIAGKAVEKALATRARPPRSRARGASGRSSRRRPRS